MPKAVLLFMALSVAVATTVIVGVYYYTSWSTTSELAQMGFSDVEREGPSFYHMLYGECEIQLTQVELRDRVVWVYETEEGATLSVITVATDLDGLPGLESCI